MRKSIRLSVLVFIFCVLFSFVGNVSFAVTGKINSADYTVHIKEDGIVDVIEIIDLSLEKDIEIFSKRFDNNLEIKNFEIKEYNKEGEVKLEYEKVDNINDLKVNSYCFEDNILKVKVDKNVRKYLSISYSLEDNINIYSDCVETNLVLQENDFDYSSYEITGKVQFEDESVNLKDIYVWGHSVNDTIIKRDDELNQIKFILDEKEENQKFDIKVVFPKEIVKTDDLELTNSDITLDDIIEKENDIIQSKELKKQFEILNFKLVNIIILVIVLIVVITILLVIIKKKMKKDKNNINENETEDVINENVEDDKKQEETTKIDENE